MNKNYVFLMAFFFSLALVFVSPGSSISQDCDNSNLMSATQQIFYCPMMGSKPTALFRIQNGKLQVLCLNLRRFLSQFLFHFNQMVPW